MALLKEIVLENGVTVNYHRVTSVNTITNSSSIIEITSYTSKEKRDEEKEKLANREPMSIFTKTEYLSTEYNKDLNVDSAYDYLKGLDKFKDSEDI